MNTLLRTKRRLCSAVQMFTHVHIYRLDFEELVIEITAAVISNRMTRVSNETKNVIERECELNMIIVCYNKQTLLGGAHYKF